MPTREIAVLIEIDDTWGRNIVEAISRYAQQDNWHLLISPKDAQRRLRVPDGWQGDGLIVLLRDRSLLKHVKSLGLPAVDVCNMFPDESWLGRVCTDDVGRATMAFEHLRSRMIENFACYSPRIGRYPDDRAGAFQKVVTEAGFSCSVFPPMDGQLNACDGCERQNLADWLASLPRPVGVFAPDAYPARQLVEVVHWMRLEMPDDVAILSGDEDELLCNILTPRISSIELASHRIGFQACRILQRMMRTKKPPRRPTLVQPLRVCARRSTEHLAIDDRQIAAVVKLIWEHAPDGVQVCDLVREAAMSRRALEQRFREALGRTPAEEIRRVRLEKARQLIVTTSLSVSTIALTCGFSSGPYLTQAFKKQYGTTPSSLRIGRNQAASSEGRLTKKQSQ